MAKATEAFIGLKREIDQILEFMSAISGDHFNCNPEGIDWGHVGTLQKAKEELQASYDRLNEMTRHNVPR